MTSKLTTTIAPQDWRQQQYREVTMMVALGGAEQLDDDGDWMTTTALAGTRIWKEHVYEESNRSDMAAVV